MKTSIINGSEVSKLSVAIQSGSRSYAHDTKMTKAEMSESVCIT